MTQKSKLSIWFFRVELGEEYLSIVSMQFGQGNGQAFVLPVDHDCFFQPNAPVAIVSDTEIETIDLVSQS